MSLKTHLHIKESVHVFLIKMLAARMAAQIYFLYSLYLSLLKHLFNLRKGWKEIQVCVMLQHQCREFMVAKTATKGSENVVQRWRACRVCARPQVSYTANKRRSYQNCCRKGSLFSVFGKWEDWNININDSEMKVGFS